MKSIVLNKITQNEIANGTRIEFQIDIGDKSYELYYDFYGIDCSVGKLPELFDGIAVLFLPYAVRLGYDLRSEYPISEELYYALRYQVIPHLYATDKARWHEAAITAPTTKEKYDGKWNGTGVSCGVDSLSAIYEYMDPENLPDYRLTHLVYLKVGQHADLLKSYDPEAERVHYDDGLKNATAFAREIGIPMVIGESNYNDITTDVFGYENRLPTFTYRNLGSVLLLQNHFSKYFYASSHGDVNVFKVDLLRDVSRYERWLVPLISTDNLKFHIASKAMERFDKTAFVARHPSSYDHLSVCWRQTKNCGYCSKCIRTLLTLDTLGELEHYENVFDLDFYRRRKKDYLALAWFRHVFARMGFKADAYLCEIIDRRNEKGLPKPSVSDMIKYRLKRLKNKQYPYVKE